MSLLNSVKYYQKSIAALGVILVLAPMIISLFRGEIYCDSAYYICHAQLLSQGMVPYEDFCFGYTPLWLYIAAALKILFRIPDGSFVFYLALLPRLI